jgi:hypothetical protein
LKKQKEQQAILQEPKEDAEEEVHSLLQEPKEDAEEEVHSLLHKKEGDRILALGDEFAVPPEAAAAAPAVGVTNTNTNTNLPPCIATDFGKPLDVLQDDIPPLHGSFAQVQRKESKDPSSTLGSSPASSTTEVVSTAASAVTIDEADTSSGDSDVLSQSVTPEAVISPLSVETKKSTDEGKQRALLTAHLEQEQEQKGKVLEREANSTFIKEEGDRFVMMGDHVASNKEDSKTPRGDTELKMNVEGGGAEDANRASATLMEVESEPESSPRNKDPIPDRQTTPTLARQQSKSPEEEKRLQERYGGMSLEERAFASLYDLGMIEKNLNPDDPDYDHSNDDEIFL